ncbi:MAG: hypothetical protein WCG85_02505, partial [Polyangia bacterium]
MKTLAPAPGFASAKVTPYHSLAKSWHAVIAHLGNFAVVTNILTKFQYALATLRALLLASTVLKLLSRNLPCFS